MNHCVGSDNCTNNPQLICAGCKKRYCQKCFMSRAHYINAYNVWYCDDCMEICSVCFCLVPSLCIGNACDEKFCSCFNSTQISMGDKAVELPSCEYCSSEIKSYQTFQTCLVCDRKCCDTCSGNMQVREEGFVCDPCGKSYSGETGIESPLNLSYDDSMSDLDPEDASGNE